MHIDIVAMPLSKGFRKCFTIIDRFTSYLEAVALETATTKNITRAQLQYRICRYEVSLSITSDWEGHVLSDLFSNKVVNSTTLLGTKHFLTTPYHPATNGLIEQLQC